MQNILQVLHADNVLVNGFKTAFENTSDGTCQVASHPDRVPSGSMLHATTLQIKAKRCGDRRYTYSNTIYRDMRYSTLSRVADIHRLYDAFQHPIVFWKGQADITLTFAKFILSMDIRF
ncbi:hypothetical protein NPIL_305411 [Nephila pilipes]|uniref:Uncharacterized protein n=1 Tax=Nephila pilipes TaxID=299642 RepID=A0A8X6NAP6_NEPPI|nr:hypothetical protein NPIL_305411 [Nephila pilipes]